MKHVRARARPRAGLAGNPSDLYEGAVVAFTFDDFACEVCVEPCGELVLCGADGSELAARGPLEPRAWSDGRELCAAALARFAARFPDLELGRGERSRLRISFCSDIPRQAGLAGSSAIVIATLRALAAAYAVELDPFELSELALAAEVEELGAIAGPQDRVVQAYECLLAMDFAAPRKRESYAHLEPGRLPPLVLAWDAAAGESSSSIHAEVFRRWRSQDPRVRRTMSALRELAHSAHSAIALGDAAALSRAVTGTFEARASLFAISARDREMVALARRYGAAATLAGSGGAVIAVLPSHSDAAALTRALQAAGFGALQPALSRG